MLNILDKLLALLLLLGFSAFVSASETALFSLSRRDLRQLELARGLVHGIILKLRSDPQGLLATVLFGNMLVNVLYYSMATMAAMDAAAAGAHGSAYAIGIGSLIALIICGEVMPKAVAVTIPVRFSRFAAVPVFFLRKVLYPVRRVLGAVLKAVALLTRGRGRETYVTPEELQLLIRATGERGLIPLTESGMMSEIMEFAQIRVAEVMVPRIDVVAFEVNGGVDEFRRMIEKHPVNRVPIYERNIDNIIGIVYTRAVLLSDTPGIRPHLRPVPMFVPEVARIEPLLRQFRERGCQFAVAVDEYGGWAGIITLEDVVEQIVGEIRDEFDTGVEPVRQTGPDQYVLSGDVSIRDWCEIFGIDLDLAEVATLGGFLMLQLGRLPREGDTVRLGNLLFTVQKLTGRRPAEVRIQRINDGGPQ